MASQEFCLKWNNHHVTLVSVLDRLLSSETLVDITLVAEGKSIRVHRVVLAACSSYFQDIVDLHQDKSLVIFLKDVKYVELQALVDYMYRGEVRVAQNSLASLIRTAESLKIKGLAEAEDEALPPEPADIKPPDRDSPIRKRRRRSGDSFSKKDLVPPAPTLQPAPIIQLKEDEPLVPVASTPRVVKQAPPPIAPAVESVHSSDLDIHNVESNSADFVKEYLPQHGDESVNHGLSPVMPKFEMSGDEMGNDTDHGQEEEWNEEDFSALVSEQSGNADGGEHSRSLANNSQQGSSQTLEKPGNCYRCAEHIEVYKCTNCPREYKLKSSLVRHLKLECSGRRFVCDICSQAFSHRHSMKRHIERVHKKALVESYSVVSPSSFGAFGGTGMNPY